MAEVRLHLDADASRKVLWKSLVDRGHDVTRTPNPWMPLDASDESQLLGATAQGRAIFTFNVRDFSVLARMHPHHRGIVLAAQSRWRFPDLLAALDRFLSEAEADGISGQVRWLNSWRE
ncbi:MAG: hypothetical protein GY719_00570 [bacterium]|nr:hypothetical protein [bacterium]